jgi:NAD(P)H-hydrate repair Nnr-like enzyme with NAD(P)H-hydrate dehydratase domain
MAFPPCWSVPGSGAMTGCAGIVRNLVRECQAPLVLDADALWLLAGQPEYLGKAQRPLPRHPAPG